MFQFDKETFSDLHVRVIYEESTNKLYTLLLATYVHCIDLAMSRELPNYIIVQRVLNCILYHVHAYTDVVSFSRSA